MDAGYAIGGVQLLHEISMDIQPGELIVAVGPNGAGKSTLMKLLSGEILPSLGRVSMDDVELGQCPSRRIPDEPPLRGLRRRRVSLL